ncbi:intermembrane lipid transfer protein VPS13A-like isoform X3 [Apostichopus japonicus]|uniref:intermembrane lipid transfer protein VPS13A-like isoform X3 n=1 Tax=Stichopus japonicus TaxID=307972 RepID=UPI003AB3F1B0
MVFESLVVDLLNRFLGPYVENLDASQLKLGIWSGDAVLQELFVKEGALDQLNLPVRIKFGHLGKLTLKIPWKNLYSAPVEATLEGLHLLVVPNADIKYDAESEAKSKWESKQKTLQGIEDAKKKEAERDKPTDPKAAGFAEKVATQVIKNIQIKVNDIHVRYEDRTTNKEAPFAIGATLEGFSVLTTDENWLPCILDQSVEMIYKLVQLNSLAVYWNTDSPLYSAMERPQLMAGMKESVAKKDKVPPGYQYLIAPISSQAQMRINPRPEAKMEIPKAWLNLVVNSIAVALQRKQYRDVMKLLQNFEMMARNDPFRKYKPDCPLKGNAKKWWHYAMNSVMKEEIKRRSELWSWKHMEKHRKMCKQYTKLYLDKLDTSKPGKDLIAKVEALEKELDVLNITLCRQQAEAEFRRLGKKRQAEGGGGWFGGWLGGKKKKEKKEEEKDMKERFQDAMTEEEKAKMYSAIGYSENVPDPAFPPDYVGVIASVKLEDTSVRLIEDAESRGDLVKVAITDLSANFNQRPSAEAIKLEAQLGDFSVLGTPLNGTVPQMVESQTQLADTKLPMIDFNLETNPVDGLADQRIRLKSQPIKVTYDANTVIEITKFFLPPDDVQLDDLSAAATTGLMDMGGQSTTGLQFMVDNKKITDIGIEIKPLYVVVPEKGIDDGKGRTLVIDLGEIGMKTQNDSRHIGERKENESEEELIKKAYDRFDISLKSMQVILAGDGDDWQAIRTLKNSSNHILQPLGLNLLLQKCMVEDARLPKIKMTGDLPDITLDISDFKLEELMKLILSIPFPEGRPKPADDAPKEVKFTSRPASSRPAAASLPPVSSSPSGSPAKTTDRKVSDVYVMAKEVLPEEEAVESDLEYYSADEEMGSSVDPARRKKKPAAKEMTVAHTRSDVQIKFELQKIAVNLSQRKDGLDSPLMAVGIQSLGVGLDVRPMDMSIEASLGSISVEHKQFKTLGGKELFLVSTPAFNEEKGRLLTFALKKADKKHPEFSTRFKSILQNMDVKFTGLKVVAHSEAILNLTEFADNLVASLKVDKKEEETEEAETVDEGYSSEDDKKPVVPRRKRKPTEEVDIQLDAKLDEISLFVCSNTQAITDVKVTGLEAGVTVQKDKTAVSACLQAITVTDPTEGAVHPRILSTIDPEVFKMKLTLYNQATEGASYSDMEVVDIRVGLTLGCIRVVFLNKFVAAILSFVEPFSRAKAKAAEAGASAAQSAKTAAADLQSKASRVALDVTLKAPLIVVPRSSTADRGLVANLGELTVKNHFTIASGTEGKQVPAVLDNMDVCLSSIQLSRAIIEKEETTADVLLLEPMQLQAGLVRNMAPWFHGVPAIAVSGKMETIRVAISTDDFGIIMAIINENIAEGDVQKAPVEEEKVEEEAIAKPEKSPSKEAKEDKKDEEAKEEKSEVWVQVQAGFEVGEIGVDLYTGKVHLENKTGRQVRRQEKKLGSFQVITIAGSATINSDSSILATARLADVLLSDHRPERGDGITKMVYCRDSEDGSPCDMVSVKFEQNAKQDKIIEANLQNLHACICTEFLMSAANIFTKGMAESAKTAPEKPARISTQPKAVPATTGQTSSSQPASAPPVEAPPQQGSVSIKAAIKRPEIILVADSSSKDTNALVLQFEADVSLNQSENSLEIQGGLNALRINACPYLEDKRKGSINKVLVPCNVGFNLSNPDKKGMKISATIPEIVLNISPPTVMVLSAAAQNLTPPPDEDEEEVATLPPDLWSIKDLASCNFWFLREDDKKLKAEEGEEGTDVAELFAEESPTAKEPQLEELVASIDSIQVKIEAEGGKRFVPMLILQSSVHAVVKDWSSKLTVHSSLKMEVSCYNERVAAWEPLVEPIEYEPGAHHPFELQVSVVKNDDIVDTSSLDKSDSEEDGEAIHLAPPAMTVTVTAPENLELTVTKTSLLLFQKLGEAFGEAVKNPGEALKDNADIPACTVINKTGLKLDFKPGEYYQMPANSKGGRIHLEPSESSALEILPALKASIKGTNQATQTTASQDMKLAFQLEGYQEITDVNLVQAGCILYNLKPTKKSGDVVFSVVIDVQAQLDARKVIIRSPMRIINHFHCPLQVFTKASNWVEKIGDLPADSEFVVPLEVAHTSELLVGPNDEGYHTCDKSIQWRTLISEKKEGKKSVTFSCPKKEEGHTPFFFNAHCRTQSLRYVKGSSLEAPKYDIHINPVVTLKNLLSVPVFYTLQGTEHEFEIKSTESTQMTNVDIGKTMMFMRIPDYNGLEWKGEMTLRTTLKEYSQWGFRGDNGKWMEVGVWVNYKQGFQDMAIFTPYWLINKTGLPLSYKGTSDEVFEHPAEKQEPIMFAYPTSKSIAPGKNKIQVKCSDSQWSDKFSLDAVGSTGFISCKTKEKEFEAKGEGIAIPKKYSLGVQIQLSYLSYTKMVLLTPRYLVVNETDGDICVSEPHGQTYDVEQHGCKPFWPIDKKDLSEMFVKKKGGKDVSLPFTYGKPHTTVLRLGEGSGIIVEVQITEAATVVAFRNFLGGNFTLQIINDTEDMPVTFHQQGVKDELKLEPRKAQLYTWQQPMGNRKLVWKVDEKENTNNLIKDGIGEIKFNSTPVYWVSFLDGTQRLLLFTEDIAKATKAQQAAELEQVDQEVILSLPGIGLSLVNNFTRKEISYIGITSSGIIWQNKIRRRWKDLNIKEMKALEDGYQKHQVEVANNKDAPPKNVKLEHHLEVDFTSMVMVKPNKRSMQRTYQHGVWLQLRKSAHQFQFHIKLNRLQVDNQTPAAIFPTVLAPVPLPKTVAAESAPKPMIEFSVMMRTSEHSTVKQFKYLKVLVQEMAVKLDMGFLSSIAGLFAPSKDEEVDETVEKRLELMKSDFGMVTSALREAEYVQVALAKDFNFYDSFHLSPLKIHVSFSLSDTGVGESDVSILNAGGARANTMNLIMQSVGVTLTNVDDVLFKLGFFEREYQFYTPEQLQSEVVKHYSNQALKQLYVLVLGLDVIGNPFGFVRGVGEGVKDFFYEPYQGIVQGPEEFAEGVALGMRSLFGHAVGGAAGAVSRITGTLGKGLAALTMDEEYKRKRQQAINQKPATFQEGVARGGKGLVMGFYEGVSGVVKDPLKGAKKEGARGFFKGVGKGLAGVVAKPTGGIIDFASGTFEGIRRVVDVSEEVKKIRAPRYLGPDGVTKPYVRRDAEGLALLQMTEKGKFAAVEDYVAHMMVTSDKKSYLLVTTSRIIYTHRGDVMGSWVVEFEFLFKNLKDDPSVSDKGILITPKEKEGEKKPKKGLGLGLLKHKHSAGKLVQYLDKKEAQEIIAKASQARAAYLKDAS